MFKLFTTLALAVTLSACASKRLRTDTELLSASSPIALGVTSEVVRGYSDKYNMVLQLNFESQDGHWIRIDRAELDLTNEEGTVQNIIIGRDLSDWLNAKAEEQKIQKQNEDVGGLGLVTLGAAAMAIGGSGNNSGAIAAGAVAAGGGTGILLRKEYREALNAAQQPNWVPETHLYAPFNIPSMSFVKRWVLINSPTGKFNRWATLNVRTVEGEKLSFKVSLRK